MLVDEDTNGKIARRGKIKSLSLGRRHQRKSTSPDPVSGGATKRGVPPRYINDTSGKDNGKQAAGLLSEHASLRRSLSPPSTSSATTATTFEAYQCPICTKDLTHIQSRFGRQQHVDECLLGMDSEARQDDPIEASSSSGGGSGGGGVGMDVSEDLGRSCLFCSKSLVHLQGSHLEHHYEQCMARMEAAERDQRHSTFAGHASFLRQLTICPMCHRQITTRSSLRSTISHLKRCAREQKLSMVQLLRKIQWMRWGHLPTPSLPQTPANPPIYTQQGQDTVPAAPSRVPVPRHDRHATLDHQGPENGENNDDDFSDRVQIYRTAAYVRPRERTPPPSEEEQLAMALSLSMHEGSVIPSSSRRRRQDVDLNAANIITMEESRALVHASLAHLFERQDYHHQRLAQRQRVHPGIHLPLVPTSSIPNPSLWLRSRMIE